MAFKLRARNFTKEEERRICRKYARLLKKKNKDSMEIICDLFLETIYLYFDNPKRKLHKLFFPVIMANFMEIGSINSVIREYRIKKKLYSESYTCRILKQLNEDDSLEISRIFRKILFKLLKQKGLKNKGYCVAIDITAKPFYGNKNLFMIKGTKNRKLKEFEMSIKAQCKLNASEYFIIESEYIFGEGKPKEYTERVRLFAIYEDNHVFYFITNIWNISLRDCYLLADCYGYRFGIETNYRVDNIFSALTSSVTASVRYLLMQVSLIAQNLWMFVNFLIIEDKYRQPREKFKGNCSVLSIVKARIKKLSFIWRPIITAVQFKRGMEKLLG